MLLVPAPDSARAEVLTILSGMHDGPVKDAVRRDPLLLKLASKLYITYGQEKKDILRARVREMGRVVVELQRVHGLQD